MTSTLDIPMHECVSIDCNGYIIARILKTDFLNTDKDGNQKLNYSCGICHKEYKISGTDLKARVQELLEHAQES